MVRTVFVSLTSDSRRECNSTNRLAFREKLHVLDVPDGERAHYSSKTYDIEYDFPFGIQELEESLIELTMI